MINDSQSKYHLKQKHSPFNLHFDQNKWDTIRLFLKSKQNLGILEFVNRLLTHGSRSKQKSKKSTHNKNSENWLRHLPANQCYVKTKHAQKGTTTKHPSRVMCHWDGWKQAKKCQSDGLCEYSASMGPPQVTHIWSGQACSHWQSYSNKHMYINSCTKTREWVSDLYIVMTGGCCRINASRWRVFGNTEKTQSVCELPCIYSYARWDLP